jgi:DNA-binding SARP family transcriptional activator
MNVVGSDPLRESAQRVLIEAHLAEGNIREARRAYGIYRRMALRELRVEPSAALTELLAGHCPARGAVTELHRQTAPAFHRAVASVDHRTRTYRWSRVESVT